MGVRVSQCGCEGVPVRVSQCGCEGITVWV